MPKNNEVQCKWCKWKGRTSLSFSFVKGTLIKYGCPGCFKTGGMEFVGNLEDAVAEMYDKVRSDGNKLRGSEWDNLKMDLYGGEL